MEFLANNWWHLLSLLAVVVTVAKAYGKLIARFEAMETNLNEFQKKHTSDFDKVKGDVEEHLMDENRHISSHFVRMIDERHNNMEKNISDIRSTAQRIEAILLEGRR